MSFRNERIHFFHANATAIGGHINKPVAKIIPVQSPTSLTFRRSRRSCQTGFSVRKNHVGQGHEYACRRQLHRRPAHYPCLGNGRGP